MFNSTFGKLQKSLENGYGINFAKIQYNTPDWEYIQNLKYNTAVFSAFKQNSEIADAWQLLTDENGKQRSWKEFYAEARKQSRQYNRVWLQTEFNQASQSALTARQWREFENNADLYPNLRYVTAGDENVRLSHKELDGKVFPINHSFWDSYYPPNGWGCRCVCEQTDSEPNAELPNDLPTMPEYMKNNTGKTAKVWDSQHPYFGTGRQKEVMNFVHEQIKPSTDIVQAFSRYRVFGSNYKQLSFNGNNGGYQVAHKLHNFDKIGGKYERTVGRKLQAIGKEVEFLAEGQGNRLDIKVNGMAGWEIKGTATKNVSRIRKQLAKAHTQGANDLIFHMEDLKLKALAEAINREQGKGIIPNVWYFNKDGKLINVYKKSQP